jgi:hypothetical protein
VQPLNSSYGTALERWNATMRLRRELDMATYFFGRVEAESIDDLIARWVGDAHVAGVPVDDFTQMVRAWSASRDVDRLKDIVDLLGAANEEARAALAEVPCGLEKALDFLRGVALDEEWGDGVYDAMCTLADEIDAADVATVRDRWRQAWRENQDAGDRAYRPGTGPWWVSRDWEDLFDAVSRYRAYETFELGAFRPVFDAVQREVGERVLEATYVSRPFDIDRADGFSLRAVAWDVWLLSRSPTLTVAFSDVIALALRGIANARGDDGSWPGEIALEATEIASPPRFLPDPFLTSMSALLLLKLSTSEGHRTLVEKSVDWLLQRQDAAGYWTDTQVFSVGIR